MDTIFIRELRIETLVGIYAWEAHVPQAIELDLEIALHTTRAAQSQDIADTIDYAQVVRRVRETLAAQHFPLLESLAETLVQLVMTEFGAPWVKLSVAKLAPLPGVKKLGISIERGSRN